MFQATGSFDLDCMNKQPLLQRYESEEEDISESEVGGQDNTFSPVEFQRFESDQSADEISIADDPSDTTDFSHLVTSNPSTEKAYRPVSMNTVKRSSDATFVAGPYIFDNEEDMIIELPSPDNSPALQTSESLQPSAHVPESQRSSRHHSFRSPSPASCFSDDESDVLVAEKVTYVEPTTKPNLISISPTASHPPPVEAPASLNKNISKRDRNLSVRREQSDKVSPLRQSTEIFKRATGKRSPLSNYSGEENTKANEPRRTEPLQRGKSLEQMGPSASISCLSEVPMVPHPVSSRSQSISISRPRTSLSEKPSTPTSASHSRFPSKGLRRPPSLRTMSNFTFPFLQSRPASPRVEEPHTRSMSSSSFVHGPDGLPPWKNRPFPRFGSPAPYCSSPAFSRDWSDSINSSSTLSGNSSSLPMRYHTVKHSTASSLYSTNSFRSDMPNDQSLDDTSFHQKAGRRKSLRRNKQQPESPEKSAGKSFLGLRLGGKRKSTMKTSQS